MESGNGAGKPTHPFNANDRATGYMPDPTTAEIVRVTAIAGDVLTVTRAQEGTVART